MKTSKLIAIAIFIFLFAVPFRILFLETENVTGAKFVGLMLLTVIGFLIAFGIGTNEPFDKKKKAEPVSTKEDSSLRRAA